MANRDYWQKRFVLLEESQINKGTAYYHELEKQYRKASGEVEKELSKWYARLAVNNNLSMAEAKKLLDRNELEEFHWTVEEYIEKGRTLNISDQWAKQLENASAKVHISRFEALKLQMQQQIEVLYGNELDSMDKFMKDIYTDTYYRTAYEIQKGLGVGSDFMRLNDKKVSQIIAKPWAADGSNFSSRIWKQKAQLITELQNQITQDMALGRSPKASINAIKDRFKVSSGQAGRLVMTETAFFHSAAQKDTFNKLNVEEYEIVATLDNKTSEICQNMDGKHMPMSEFKPGITAPPFHCWCRSTTVPYFNDEFTVGETRAARSEETGKYYEVPANMTYPEWKKAFVDGGSKENMNEINHEREKSHKGIIRGTEINRPVVESAAYKRRFETLNETQNVIDLIWEESVNAINHRSGTEFEDLIFINSDTNEMLISNQFEVAHHAKPTKKMMSLLKRSGNRTIIAIHNHPNGSTPSIDDIKRAIERNYKYGIVVGHNGYIFKYEIIGTLNEVNADIYLDNLNKLIYNTDEIEDFESELKECLDEIYNSGVKIEVL